MAKILIIDDAGNHHIITDITDNDLPYLFQVKRLAEKYNITSQTLAARCCKFYEDGEERGYRSLVTALTEPVRKYNKKWYLNIASALIGQGLFLYGVNKHEWK